MALSDLIARQLPYLRRYARILTGSQSLGDSFVRELLEAALADSSLREQISTSRTGLFSAFSRIYASAGAELSMSGGLGSDEGTAASNRLELVTPLARQALLLNAVEDFSESEIAEILDCPEDDVREMIDSALADIDSSSRLNVLIIEDEPLIAFQIEEIVTSIGHVAVGTAATHAQAVALFDQHRPDLVLADIQLADGSSGIDAVNEILGKFSVPVIFITAFPERLLTGERPEPTYLITKPFSDDFVRATIGQVAFFGSTAPLR
ncbi:CheY-like chemotaxis protein [Sphingobium sp. B2D3A]|uniref:response regulator n=1 Tax=Sphingobium TaxID=165695 RepID=UPI0015EC01FC|nr:MULTISPECIES: response regulator [Sphingobium]MCW2337498.1 CheY-like chemotaxis protein [Sphingobium sp. B2D3A]MCW2362288.1 CheY-like chemotaxis protein [Sphingobium sp. B10D3B]MCW2365913.1 CheY-like chemotaxis protein [Sphingobium sp. B7D2B]MCW2369987.1 CheY-like chemotaxis protein [Sphingobium sp. B11D3D]MCW2383956.1 CheY-like chemotaxis protein [Sphingobium sp. B2D3D]